MTTIINIPLSNGWILIGDKLITYHNDNEEVIIPIDINKKIDYISDYFIGYTGDPDLFLRFKNILIFNDNLNFDEFKTQFLKTRQDFPVDVELTILLIVLKTNTKYIIDISKLKTESNLVDFLSNGCFVIGNGYKASKFILESIPYFANNDLADREIISRCISILNNMAMEDPKCTGSPYLFGCDILICRENNVKQYDVKSNGCKYKEQNELNWINI